MLDFRCGIENVPTINLTREEAVLHYLLVKGNIADDPEDDLEVPTTALGHLSCQQTVCDELFLSVAPSHTGSGVAPATSSFSLEDYSYSFASHKQAGVLSLVH